MKTKKEREYSEQFKSAPFSYLRKVQIKTIKPNSGRMWSEKVNKREASKLSQGDLAAYIVYLRENDAQEQVVVAENRVQGVDGKYHYTPLGRRYYARLLWRRIAINNYTAMYRIKFGGSGLFIRPISGGGATTP